MERAVAVLEAIGAGRSPQTLASLTAQLGLPKSSLLGICNTLTKAGLLQRNEFGAFWLGRRLVDLSHAYLSKTNTATHFLEAWEALKILPEETVVLSALEGADVVYIACQNGTHGLTFNYRIGMRLPASCTASGKAMLSTLPPAAIDSLFGNAALLRLTAKSVKNLEALRRDLASAQRRGYAIDKEETREGMCCIGAPVFSVPNAPATVAIAISMLKAEFGTAKRDKVIETVLTLARNLSERLGGL